MILVVGATGTLGREAVRQLLTSGQKVRALSRRKWNTERLQHPNLETVQGDLIDRASIISACHDVEAVLASAHALMGTGAHDSRAVDDLGHHTLIDVAKNSGVKRFVYVSARGAAPRNPVDFYRTKARVESHLKSSGLQFSILRPSAFLESHAHYLLGKPLLEHGMARIRGDGRNPINYVSARDVAAFALIALNNPGASGETIEIGGPSNVSKRDIAAAYLRMSGRTGTLKCVPTALLRLMRPFIRPFNPVIARLLDMSIWSETTDQTFDAGELRRTYAIEFASLEDFIRAQIRQVSSAG